ncbi:MAG: ABC transporter permease [Bifidobacteriaceae bacterium]|jgi:peptide/nickel transport system permease protein|nr:ABC transporter permease [Bifidobacteriaceae bacterium]
MLKFTVKRLVSAVALMVFVATGTFFMAHKAIPDPVANLFGKVSFTAEQYEAKKAQLGLDQPILTQFWNWFRHLLTGDFGTTWVGAPTPIIKDLAVRLPVTLSIVILGLAVMAVLGAILGVLAGIRPGSWGDRMISASSVVFFAVPGFLVSIALLWVLAVKLGWFPVSGYIKPERDLLGWLRSITLPAVSLALGGVVMIAVQLRNAIVTANSSDYVRTLRARGLPPRAVALHLLRSAAPAAITIIALMFVSLLSGAVILESMFNMPGIGSATKDASQTGNIPMILALTVVSVLFVVIVNFLLDLVLGWINPKARIK